MSLFTQIFKKIVQSESKCQKVMNVSLKKNITSMDDLDEYLEYVDEQFLKSDDDGRIALDSFYFSLDQKNIPTDPYSSEYHQYQMQLYSSISGRDIYSIKNEESVFDYESIKDSPFPYYTKSASTVGDQLLAIGYIIKKTNIPANSNIIEFGPGWGNLTITLAQMGHNVTCVEVEKRFTELIAYRARSIGKDVTIINQDMLEFLKNTDKKFDAVIFYESFHHCHNPIELVKNLSNILSKEGIICFASEPIVNSSIIDIPYPSWGIRLDGMSIWSIRKFGWMELGFITGFFQELLLNNGFVSSDYISDVSPLTHLIIAKKK